LARLYCTPYSGLGGCFFKPKKKKKKNRISSFGAKGALSFYSAQVG
jgi:hypothetical protein